VIPLWRPLIVATGAALVAIPIDRHARLLPRGGVVRWPLLALATLVGCYLFFAIPWLALLVAVGLGGVVLVRRRRLVAEEPAPSRVPRGALVMTGVAFLAVTLFDRAATPYFWDAFVWLAKARYAAGGLEGLIAGGLQTTLPPFIPSGYPLLEPLMVALLGGLSSRPEFVVAGAIGLELLITVLYLSAVADDERLTPRDRATRLATVTVVLLASPLVLVHLRSSYVDLPLGLLVGAFAVLLGRPGAGVASAVVAVAAVALKDEGMVHVAAITLVGVADGLARQRDAALVRRAIASGLCAATVMAAWHLRLDLSGIANADHALSLPDWHRLRMLAGCALAHLLEFQSWGALAVLGVGGIMAVAIKPRSAPRAALWYGSLLLADAIVLFVALLATPERVMEFVTGGTLLNRLAMQLAPLTALLVAAWLAPGSKTAQRSEERPMVMARGR
jgi:hypothetical protein